MHGSKLPLTVWFWAAYLMATHSNGLSARQMWRQLGLGSYKSAWLLCAKLRRAMVDPARALLSGVVEIDETQVPYRTKDAPGTGGGGRSPDGKMQVCVAVAIIDDAPGRLRLGTIEKAASASVHPFSRPTSPRAPPSRPTAEAPILALPGSSTSPTSLAPWRRMSSCRGCIA